MAGKRKASTALVGRPKSKRGQGGGAHTRDTASQSADDMSTSPSVTAAAVAPLPQQSRQASFMEPFEPTDETINEVIAGAASLGAELNAAAACVTAATARRRRGTGIATTSTSRAAGTRTSTGDAPSRETAPDSPPPNPRRVDFVPAQNHRSAPSMSARALVEFKARVASLRVRRPLAPYRLAFFIVRKRSE